METDKELARITICDLAYAYRLQYAKCRSMAENLKVYFPFEIENLTELDEFAVNEAQFINSSPLVDLATAGLIIDVMRPNLVQDWKNNKNSFTHYQDCISVIVPALQTYFLGISEVNKKDAVIFLHEHGFKLLNPVVGLTPEYVTNLIANKEVAQPVQANTLENNIAKWEAILPTLTVNNQNIVKVVIGKFQGKSHSAICDEVFGDNIADREGKIKRIKKQAEKIATTYNLPMPTWNSRKT